MIMENNQTPMVSFTRLNVTKVTSERINVSWDFEVEGSPENIVHFVVAVKGKLADGSSWKRVEASDRHSCSITGLEPDTKYSLYIVAVYEDEEIAQCPDTDDGLVVKTPVKDVEAPHVSMNDLTASSISENGFTLIWTKANDNVTAKEDIVYRVFYKEDSPSAPWKVTEAAKGIGSYQFDDLKIGTNYLIYVEAEDEAGNVTRYPSEEFVGFFEVKTLGIIANEMARRVTKRTENSITIGWDKASESSKKERGIKYDLTLRGRDGDTGQFALDVKGYSYTFSGLKAQTNYSFIIKATDKNGNSAEYNVLTASTLAEKAPTVVKPSLTATTDSITARWDNAQSQKVYEVGIKENDNADEPWHVIRKSGISSFTFTCLKQGTTYAVYVIAYDEGDRTYPYSPNGDDIVVATTEKIIVSKTEGTAVTTNKMRVSKYFTLEDFLNSDTAMMRRIKNLPSWEAVQRLSELALFLDGLREAWGGPINVLSGFRSTELNKSVGGVSRSAHRLGFAADLVPANKNLAGFKKRVAEWIKDKKFDQCIVEKNGSSEWIHIGLYSATGEQRCDISIKL